MRTLGFRPEGWAAGARGLARSVILLSAALAAGCGGGSDKSTKPPDTAVAPLVETYRVATAATWTVSASSSGGVGTIFYARTATDLSFSGYDTGSSALAAFTGMVPMILRFPVVKGDTWSHTGSSNNVTIDATVVVADDAAPMTVPAGVFTTVLTVETVTPRGPYNNGIYVAEYRRWFAPGVGLVKVQDTWKDGGVGSGVLTAYNTPGAGTDPFPLAVGDWWTFRW